MPSPTPSPRRCGRCRPSGGPPTPRAAAVRSAWRRCSAPIGAAPAWGWSSGISSRGRRQRWGAAPTPAATGAIRTPRNEPPGLRAIQVMSSRGPGGSSSGTAASGAARAGRHCCSANSKNANSPCCWRPAARGFPVRPSGSSLIQNRSPIPSHPSYLRFPRPLHHQRRRPRRARLGMASRSLTSARQGERSTAPIGAPTAPFPSSRPIRARRGDVGQPIASRRCGTSAPALEPPITPQPAPSPPPAHPSLSSDHEPTNRRPEQRFHRSC